MRVGGLKQLDPVGGHGQVILDYSIYDARRAGFETVVFVIKQSIEEEFKARVGRRVERHMKVKYAFQRMDDLPEGYTEDGGESWTALPGDTTVSMNLWGFNRSFLDEAERRFPAFLDKTLVENPMKGEYFLPSVVEQLIGAGKAQVKVLLSQDKWYGVTYREDKPAVATAIAAMTAAGLYPDELWPER